MTPRARRCCRASAGALEQFLAVHPELARLDARFDVMVVVPRRWPRHLRGAWRSGE